MARAEVRSTAFDLAFPERKRSNWLLSFVRRGKATAQQADTARPVEQDPEYKLPKTASLLVVLLTSGLLQVSSSQTGQIKGLRAEAITIDLVFHYCQFL